MYKEGQYTDHHGSQQKKMNTFEGPPQNLVTQVQQADGHQASYLEAATAQLQTCHTTMVVSLTNFPSSWVVEISNYHQVQSTKQGNISSANKLNSRRAISQSRLLKTCVQVWQATSKLHCSITTKTLSFQHHEYLVLADST